MGVYVSEVKFTVSDWGTSRLLDYLRAMVTSVGDNSPSSLLLFEGVQLERLQLTERQKKGGV